MKRYFAVVSMMCLFALTGIVGAVAQEVQKANPATDFEYDLNEAGDGVIIKKYTGTSTEVVIPAEIEDFPVVRVDGYLKDEFHDYFDTYTDHTDYVYKMTEASRKVESAFVNTNVTSIIFPDSVTEIGIGCCANCTSLQKVILPKNLKTIDTLLFYKCKALKQIILPDGIKTIGKGSFYASNLESIKIPDSVERIESLAFTYCAALKQIILPNGIKTIDKATFYNSGLSSIEIPDTVYYINSIAFTNCAKLKTVTLGKSIEAIGDQAFVGCSNLTTFNIVVNHIEYGSYNGRYYEECRDAFSGCSSLSLKEKKKIRDTGYTGEF